jgi:hypothetical protein
MTRNDFLLIIFILALGGCNSSDRTPRNENKQAVPPSAEQKTPASSQTPQPAPEVNPSYASSGIGLARADWERLHGNPGRDTGGGFIEYEGGRYLVRFADGNVAYIERIWGDRGAVPLDVARRESKNVIPADSKLDRTYTAKNGGMVDLYMSASLKPRFSDIPSPRGGATLSKWIGGKPGNFIVLYRQNGGQVTSFVIDIGNNP